MKKQMWFLLTLLVAMVVSVAACTGGQAPAEATQAPAEATQAPAEAATQAPAAASSGEMMGPAGGFLERAMGGEFSGTSVSMMGPFTEEDAVKFNNAIADFEQATGIDIQYEGTKEFEATISVRVDAGDAPDVVDFPQPGLLGNFAQESSRCQQLYF